MATITCREFRSYLEPWMEGVRTPDAQAHLRTCANCSSLLSDLEAIHAEARSWRASEQDAPERVWTSLRAQLEHEGLIRETIPARDDHAQAAAPARRMVLQFIPALAASRAGWRISRGARRRGFRAQRSRQQARQRSALAQRHADFHFTAQRAAQFRRTKHEFLRDPFESRCGCFSASESGHR